MATARERQPATVEEWRRHRDDEHVELVRGTLIEKASPSVEHSDAQAGTTITLGDFFQRGRGGPGGWRFFTELDIQLGAEVFRPDLCGFRRERMAERPRERPVKLVPDWVCEILSLSNQSRDRVEKLQTYFQCNVPYYWIIDPVEGTLEAYRRTDLAYALVQSAHRGQTVRAEPFDAVS